MKYIVTGLILALATPAMAFVSQNLASADTSAPENLSLEFARAMNPEELMIAQLETENYAQMLTQVMMSDPYASSIEADHPGAVAFAVRRIHPFVVERMRQRIPSIHQTLAEFFAQHFTENELRAAIAFFRSPSGARFLELQFANTSFDEIVNTFAEQGQNTTDAVDTVARDGAMIAMSRLNSEQRREVIRFNMTPTGQKLISLSPQVSELVTNWSNQRDPDGELIVAEIFVEAVGEFIAESPQ